MYKDPEEREQQIKNMSAAFRELADGILPELRRARLTINYEVIGRSDQQIQEQLSQDAKQLSLEEILYAATLTNNANEKEDIYKKAAELYPNDARAFNNIAAIEYAKGNLDTAKKYAEKAQAIGNLAEANANLGLIALQKGDVKAAENYIAKATNANGLNEIVGNLNIAQGNYAQAEQNLSKTATNSAALAQIMNKNYSGAVQTLNNVKATNGMTDYLKAVAYARQGNNTQAAAALASALSKDPSLKKYADADLELMNISK